jgi:2-keto-4-pentenoate hydratase/2-oxohepta-3-ene-1,7-dioic acid hydratase in catechol pathway
MRLIRFLCDGKPHAGVPVDNTTARLIAGSICGEHRLTDEILPIEKLLVPIEPTDILCIGLNYRAHAEETKSDIPANPMLFIKSSNALAHPGQVIQLPSNSSRVDYEGELVVVVGTDCKNVSREQALDYVFGYTIGNDVSARDWQKDKPLNGGQFARGKSFDGFAPIGPWIVTRDEVPNPNALRLQTTVSGEVLQDSTTADMIFDVPAIIASLSTTMTIRAGTIIFTGTPSGVGDARKPPRYLRDGDTVTVDIEKLGRLENRFVA